MNRVIGGETSIPFSSFRSASLSFVFQLNLYLSINHKHSLRAAFLCHISLFFWECCRSFTVEEQCSDTECTEEWQQQIMSRNLTNEKCFLLRNHCFRSDHVFVPLQSTKLAFDIFHITDNSLPLSSAFLEDGFSHRKVKHLSGFTMSKIFQCYMQIFFIK